jgi:hypothetical protein
MAVLESLPLRHCFWKCRERFAIFLWTFRALGHCILHFAVGGGPLARFAHRLGRAVFHPSTVDCASVVSGSGKHPDRSSGAFDEKTEFA